MITVLIASAIPLVRDGLLHTLNDERGILVTAHASKTSSVLRSSRPGGPDVLVLDIALPGEDLAAMLRRLAQRGCRPAVVLFGDWTALSADAARRLSPRAMLSLFDDPNTYARAIHFAAEGDVFISERVQSLLRTDEAVADPYTVEQLLSPTEIQVLRYLAANRTSREIAREMFISYRTVQKHRDNMVRKLNLRGHNALLTCALQNFPPEVTGERA
ncbi:MAG: response regulator transcription factor [Bacteroidetes bacterium]|nr:response regulator transcription factor [Bacteroidota bacterium]